MYNGPMESIHKDSIPVTITLLIPNTRLFYQKNFYKKMSLKNPKTLRKCCENLQP